MCLPVERQEAGVNLKALCAEACAPSKLSQQSKRKPKQGGVLHPEALKEEGSKLKGGSPTPGADAASRAGQVAQRDQLGPGCWLAESFPGLGHSPGSTQGVPGRPARVGHALILSWQPSAPTFLCDTATNTWARTGHCQECLLSQAKLLLGLAKKTQPKPRAFLPSPLP